MKVRLLTGSCYILVLAAFFCLKVLVHDFFFDTLIYAFALIGTFEMLRALKDKTTKAEKGIVYAFAIVCIPACALCENYYGQGALVVCACLFVLALALLSLLVIKHEETTLESLGCALLSAVYPTFLLCLLVLTNHAVPNVEMALYGFDSAILILFIFVISPCADSIAYVFGRFLKKYFPKKMAPTISPNKTMIGGIGGLVGGMLGALILYFIYNACISSLGAFEKMYLWLPIYLGIGLVSSIATAFGDLVESCIKRKLDIKDMGKLMPGHGGILDRIDGTLFACVVVYGAFLLVRLFV